MYQFQKKKKKRENFFEPAKRLFYCSLQVLRELVKKPIPPRDKTFCLFENSRLTENAARFGFQSL